MRLFLLLPLLLGGFSLPTLASETFEKCGPITGGRYFKIVKSNSGKWYVRRNTDGSNSYPEIHFESRDIDKAFDFYERMCKG